MIILKVLNIEGDGAALFLFIFRVLRVILTLFDSPSISDALPALPPKELLITSTITFSDNKSEHVEDVQSGIEKWIVKLIINQVAI